MGTSISLSITQNSQSVADNTSNVTVKATIKWDYGSWNATGECYGSIKIDGTNYSFSGIKFNTGQSTSGSQVVMTKTVNVKHSSDGSKTLSCSTSFYTGLKDGTLTASASKTLTTIPRKSTLSASNGTLGTAQSLTVTRQSSSFTHTIKYECGSASGTIATKSSSTSISFTPPLSLASQNTTGTSVSVKFTITTYNGSTSLGSNTKTITCSIPSSVKPSCSISVSDAAGYSVYVKGYSKFKITVKPTLAYGSAIASYSVKANGATYTTASVTTSVLASSGTLTITATVKDKRGRTGTATKTVTVYDKSTLSASNGTLNTAQNLTISRGYSGFKHTITYSCGSASGTVTTKTSDTTVAWNKDNGNTLELARQNTTGTSVSVKFTITTYCDDKSIGSNTKTITCSIPSSVKPSVSIATSDTTGLAEKYGAWVTGLSILKVSLSTTTSYGSAIASYSTTVSGKKYTSSSFEVGLITSTSEIPIKATVTDKRGRTGVSEIGLDGFLNYSTPVVSKLLVRRCDKNGTVNDKGEYAKVSYSASVTPLNNLNTMKVVLRYKKTTESSFQTGETTSSSTVFTVNKDFIFLADTGSSYDVVVTVEDSHSKVTRTTSVSTGFTLMHWGDDGRSMGIGKVAEISDVLDIGIETLFTGGIKSKTIADCNTALLTGWYLCGEGCANTPDATTFKYSSLEVVRRNTAVYQTISSQGYVAQRFATSTDNGETWTWREWEWLNPLMASGVEYRTTERFAGGIVYVKRINFGALPKTGEKSVEIGAGLVIVSIEGRTTNGNLMVPLSILNGINSVYYNKSDGKLSVNVKDGLNYDASEWSAEIFVKYAK